MDEIIENIKKLSWFNNSPGEIQEKLLNAPESFAGFMKELSERPELIGNIKMLRLIAIEFGNHFALPVFEVKNEKSGLVYEYEYIGRKRGPHHSVRGLIVLESEGEAKYFIVRKSVRFAIGKEVWESVGSIYNPEKEIRQDKYKFKNYLENEIAEQFKLPKISFDRFYDLGMVYPDVGMSSHEVSLFAGVIKENDWNAMIELLKDKIVSAKNYEYEYIFVPADELLEYLTKTNDAHALAIFGRLQALNVIKL
ncbi:hypothetical protein KKD37_02920 [Patescibacteria group bacterium]|nr:hypothetical protein [Patescibacteria group bacterium]